MTLTVQGRPTATAVTAHLGRLRRCVLGVALALAVAACGGATEEADPAATTAEEALPTDPDAAAGDDEAVVSGMCAEGEPDCEDMVVGDDEAASGGAAGSCLAGDEDCTDESYDGQDVTRPVPVTAGSSGAPALEGGAATDATGAPIDAVHALDDTTLEVTFTAGTCHLVQDVLVDESPAEVRLLVLAGMDPAVEMCTADVQQWTTTVDLGEPLGDRTVLDLSG